MKPKMFMDVDGVISREDVESTGVVVCTNPLFPEATRKPVSIAPNTGRRIKRLLETFDLIWATAWLGWECDALYKHFDLEPDWASIKNYQHAKVFSILRYVEAHGIETWAWVDDYAPFEMQEHGLSAEQVPGLILAPDPQIGLQETHVRTAIEWARQREEYGSEH